MKQLLTLLVFGTLSTAAFAHPGSHRLSCHSALNSGAKQDVSVFLTRSNGKGWAAPTIKISLNNKEVVLNTPDDMDNYGSTFHNSPLKVVTVTAEVPESGYFSVIAMPETVKAFDIDGNPVKWNFEAEKDECNDTNGSATFKAIINGYIYQDGADDKIETQILDCELTYNSGMAC
nr:hypothetical protein BHI3_31760 [Bacteriovorax sp. HI3]